MSRADGDVADLDVILLLGALSRPHGARSTTRVAGAVLREVRLENADVEER
jgi:hypothetical protein